MNASRARCSACALAVSICVAFFAGCSAGPATKDSVAVSPQALAPSAPHPQLEAPEVAAAPDWASFRQTGAALRSEISRRAAALREGPIGNRAVELASLRLAASGRDLIDAGSLGGALAALERAVSLYGGNGYAYLWLAYVHHVQGRSERAAEFAASAGRYLPRDQKVRAELAGLTQSIRHSGAPARS